MSSNLMVLACLMAIYGLYLFLNTWQKAGDDRSGLVGLLSPKIRHTTPPAYPEKQPKSVIHHDSGFLIAGTKFPRSSSYPPPVNTGIC